MNSKVYYYNPNETGAIFNFCKTLSNLLGEYIYEKSIEEEEKKPELILLCIGSDRATGDCLGPIIGYKLSQLKIPGIHIYGTLEHPVHAQNLQDTLKKIQQNHTNQLVIAIDASLGSTNHIGYITLGKGSLYPGIGVNKDLPSVGDIFITGIVNISGMLNHMLLQTTRLNVVMELADHICMGVRYALFRSTKSNSQTSELQKSDRQKANRKIIPALTAVQMTETSSI